MTGGKGMQADCFAALAMTGGKGMQADCFAALAMTKKRPVRMEPVFFLSLQALFIYNEFMVQGLTVDGKANDVNTFVDVFEHDLLNIGTGGQG